MGQKQLTEEEQKRLWKQEEPPIRIIKLWGKDSQNNYCVLLLLGEQEFGKEVDYYMHLLKPEITYTHYAVFHGVGEHLPSNFNINFVIGKAGKKIVCYERGYNTAKVKWDYDRQTRRYDRYYEVDEKYIVKEFYELDKEVKFNYYEEHSYEDYVNYLKSKNVTFEDFELIENPSEVTGFGKESPYYDFVINMFSAGRLYTRIKNLKGFINAGAELEDYKKILRVASVELACGIFQEMTLAKNPMLLDIAKEIDKSDELWAKQEYHSGLKRFVSQYLSMFDEKLMDKQKKWIYDKLPDMDFQIRELKKWGNVIKGEELKEYLDIPYYSYINETAYAQATYYKGAYTDGKHIKNIAFKNTIQMVRAYGLADAAGRIAYYLDTARTKTFFSQTENIKAFAYYQRYVRRMIDEYKAKDETKFVEAIKELFANYTNNDICTSWWDNEATNYFYSRYSDANQELWDRHTEDILWIAKRTKADVVHEFCYTILNRANKAHKFDDYDIKQLIELSQIPYEKTAKLFEGLLLPKLKYLTEFDTDIMLALMNVKSEKLQKVAKEYFVKTNGKFKPENVVNIICMDTVEKWYKVVKNNIEVFSAEEYIAFTKELVAKSAYFVENEVQLAENIMELIQNSVEKMGTATKAQKQKLIENFVLLLMSNQKVPEFIADMAENIIFYMPHQELKETLEDMNLHFKTTKLPERNRNVITILHCMKEYDFIKDYAILSILDISSAKVVKAMTETIEDMKDMLEEKTTTLLLLLESTVFALNQTAKSIFEHMELEKREKMHLLLLDSPVERTYQYALQKLDEWYGDKLPKQFVFRMLEHPCIAVKKYLSEKMEKALSHLETVQPDLYIYYVKTILYLPNKATKSKEYIYSTILEFIKYYPEKKKEIEEILLDIGSTNVKINAERALVTFAQIQKGGYAVCK